MYPNSLFHVLTFYHKFLLSQFFSRDIRMRISILTGFQNGRISRQRDSHNLLKNLLFEAYFPAWRPLVCQLLDLYSYYLMHMRSFSVLMFWHTYAHSPPNSGSKRIPYLLKNGHILLKDVLLKLNFFKKGHLHTTCLFYFPSVCHPFFHSSLVLAYVCTFQS